MPAASPLTLIFDCDGVLVDSERLSHTVLQQMLAEYGRTLSLQQTLDHFMGTSTERCHEVLAELIGRAPPDDFWAQFNARSFELFRTGLQPVAGVPELLRTLAVPFCVASNGPRQKMQVTLGHTGLLAHFEGRWFSAEDVHRPKPAPDLFLHAAAAMRAEPQRCVVVEDSPTGVTAARAAGMRVLGYAAMGQHEKLRAAGSDTLFTRMDELPALLAALA